MWSLLHAILPDWYLIYYERSSQLNAKKIDYCVMQCKVFRQQNLGIFAILVLSLSIFSISQTSSQFASGELFSNQVNDLEYTTFYAEQQADSLQISDNVFVVKNNLEIIAAVFEKNTQKDSIAISDSVYLAKHVPVVNDSNWNTVAISERITKTT